MFVTDTPILGDAIGGISGADNKCAINPNNPSDGATFKAMLVHAGVRRACSPPSCSGGVSEHIDWVLYPIQEYRRLDGTVIATTNANGIFTFPLVNSFGVFGDDAWTGLTSDFQVDNSPGITTCNNWGALRPTSDEGATSTPTSVNSDAQY